MKTCLNQLNMHEKEENIKKKYEKS